jgi:hypothetical protein
MSAYAGIVSARLLEQLVIHNYQQTPKPGRILPEFLFRLPLPDSTSRDRRPNIAFVSFERAPIDQLPSMRDDAWTVVPDLAVEVISPSDLAEGVMPKRVHAALRLDCLLVDVCVTSSSSSSSAFNSARHSGGVHRQAVRRSLAIAERVRSTISSHRPDTTAARS